MKKLLSGLLLLISFSCSKEGLNNSALNNEIKVFGHGGLGVGRSYPMNSLESILAALNMGAHGTEIDVQMTKDSVLVAYHGTLLETETNVPGYVLDYTFDQLNGVVYINFPLGGNYKLCSMNEIFEHCPNPQNYTFTFDCKFYSQDEISEAYLVTFKNAITTLIQQYQLETNIYIESQDQRFLQIMKDTELPLFIYPNNFETGLSIAEELGLYGITIANDNLTAENVALAHEQNIKVTTWNLHTQSDNIAALNKGVDYVQTEQLEFLLNLLKTQ